MHSVAMEENLGKALRTAREAANLTVDDAVYRGGMPRAVVEALESDDIGFFPSPLYARSFLKQYGDYLGVDVSPWIDDLVPTTLIDSEAVESFLDLSDPDPAPSFREKEKTRNPGGGAMAALWLIVITGGLVWFGVEYVRKLDARLSAAPPPVQQTAPAPPEEETAAPAETGEEEKPVTVSEPEAPKRAIIVNLPEE